MCGAHAQSIVLYIIVYSNDYLQHMYFVLQLTAETYADSVAMLSQIIEFTENNTNEQTNEVLSTVASYFQELAIFVNESNLIINTTVSIQMT